MKKKILALAIGGVLSAGAQAAQSDLLITEYVEGSGDNRAIEITNFSSDKFTFDDTYTLQYSDSKYTNTVLAPDGSSLLDGVVVEGNKSIVIVNNAADDELKDALFKNIILEEAKMVVAASYGDQGHKSLNFNGNDQVTLYKDTTPIDLIGTPHEKEYWGAGVTLRLYAEQDGSTPVQDPSYIETQWAAESEDTFDGLGIPDLTVRPTPPQGIPFVMAPNETFREALARYAASKDSVIISEDLNPNLDGKQGLYVTRTYGFNFNGFRNNITASYSRPNFQPNQVHVAGSQAALNYNQENINNTLLIDSSSKASDGRLPYYPTFHTNASENYIRINDTIDDMSGVITEVTDSDTGLISYTLTVNNTLNNTNFIHNSPRKPKAEIDTVTESDSFAIKVATQNVLNLFNSPFGGAQNLNGDNRGAETDEEYPRQKEKLVEAIYGLNADIVGLMEIENNGFSDTGAIAEFVEAINAKYFIVRDDLKDDPDSETNRYVFLGFDSNGDAILDDLDSVGSDVITSGIIYRPTKVSIESSGIIKMPEQHAPTIVNDNNVVVKNSQEEVLENGDNYQRNTVLATFTVNNTSKKLTVVVNHLKSKGSTCYEEWDGVDFGTTEIYKEDAPDLDFQGSCENFRVAAAVQIGEELEDLGGDQVVLGDFNSYAYEDPMLVLTSNPTNKKLVTARDTFIGKKPQFNTAGNPVEITKSYGYISALDKIEEENAIKEGREAKPSWSYSFNDEIGSLDHVLITPSLENRLIDAQDWHINAAESTYYDYNIVRFDSDDGLVPAKGSTGHDDFYAADAYRSSDHDSAIISLSYEYGETEGDTPVLVTISSSTMEVPYVIPTSAVVQAGDIAKISLKATGGGADLSEAIIPQYALTANQKLAKFEVAGITAGEYTATMTLERNGVTVAGSEASIKLEAAKKDSLTPTLTVPETDGSGGSFGIFGILSLLGLGFLRRK